MFFRKIREKTIQAELEKAKFKRNISRDIERQKKVNAVLANGITLRIARATGHK